MSRRVLFAIRSKLGDTLISFACVRAYADAFPDDDVTLLTRTAYAGLFRHEHGIRVIGFNSRIEMFFRLLGVRLTEPAFDILAVLWGSGTPIRRIGQWVHAKRKIAWTKRFAPELFEEGHLVSDPVLIEPAASVIRAFDPRMDTPRRLHIPSLSARYRASPKTAIAVVPIADELRRNFDAGTLAHLVSQVRRLHPGDPICVFVNPGNNGSEDIVRQPLPSGVELRFFTQLDDLTSQYMTLKAWYGTDTGLYHLAASIGIPATVFFGPTQPHKIVMPDQPDAKWIRLRVLGRQHCDETACDRPLCLHQAVATFCGAHPTLTLADTPPACPLRAAPSAELALIDMGRPAPQPGATPARAIA